MGKNADRNSAIPAQVLRQVVTIAPWGFVVTDPQLEGNPVVFANQAFEGMTGYKAEEVLGRSWHLLLGKDHEQKRLEQVSGAARRGRTCTFHQGKRILFKVLNRRSQRRSYNWKGFAELIQGVRTPETTHLPRLLSNAITMSPTVRSE